MIISLSDGKQIPLYVPILSECSSYSSSVKVPVGFRLKLDSYLLGPTGLVTGNSMTGNHSDYFVQGLDYPTIAAWISASNLVCVGSGGVEEEISEDITVTKTVIPVEKSSSKNNCLIIPNNEHDGILSSERVLKLGNSFETVELELLLVSKQERYKLPPEFSAFRVFKDKWMTLPGDVSFIETIKWSDTSLEVQFTHKNEQLEKIFCSDVKKCLEPLLSAIGGMK